MPIVFDVLAMTADASCAPVLAVSASSKTVPVSVFNHHLFTIRASKAFDGSRGGGGITLDETMTAERP
jgi:hypothetical protein